MSPTHYRPDIDGLRALAVLAVILFHAGVPFMGGGFVGVDVFFVISGFLITSLIVKDLENGTFTFAGFWERRARRILPALVVMILATLIAGWFLFLPEDYVALGKQAAAQSVFASNIFFYKGSGYFDTDSFLKPLLHTWSLAVEEQYYIFFPLAAVFVWKRWPSKITALLIGTAVCSFLICQIVMRANPSLAFYMLPFRGWELLIGALLAYRRPALSQKLREVLAAAGLACILLAVFLYDDKTMFPGVGALLPCFGAAAVIAAGIDGTSVVKKALSLRPLVFVGLISYSWYLWHWPVIVFTKYVPLVTYNAFVGALCVSGSFALAVLSWRYVETPFRRFVFMPRRKTMLAASAGAMAGLMIFGAALFLSGGLPSRLDKAVTQYASGIADDNPHRKECDKTDVSDINRDKVCETNKDAAAPSFILWGDSHADAIAPAFYKLSTDYRRNGYIATHHGCPPMLNLWYEGWNALNDCKEFNRAVLDFIVRKKIKTVVMAGDWPSWLKSTGPTGVRREQGDPPDHIVEYKWRHTLDVLKQGGVSKIYIMKDIPTHGFDVPRVLAKQALYQIDMHPDVMTREKFLASRNLHLEAFVEKTQDVIWLDPVSIMCPDKTCLYEKDGYSLFYNGGHVSVHGAEFVAPLFAPYFKTGF